MLLFSVKPGRVAEIHSLLGPNLLYITTNWCAQLLPKGWGPPIWPPEALLYHSTVCNSGFPLPRDSNCFHSFLLMRHTYCMRYEVVCEKEMNCNEVAGIGMKNQQHFASWRLKPFTKLTIEAFLCRKKGQKGLQWAPPFFWGGWTDCREAEQVLIGLYLFHKNEQEQRVRM